MRAGANSDRPPLDLGAGGRPYGRNDVCRSDDPQVHRANPSEGAATDWGRPFASIKGTIGMVTLCLFPENRIGDLAIAAVDEESRSHKRLCGTLDLPLSWIFGSIRDRRAEPSDRPHRSLIILSLGCFKTGRSSVEEIQQMCIMRRYQPPAAPAAALRPNRAGEPARGVAPCSVPGTPAAPFQSLLDPGRPGLMQACLSAVLRRARQAERVPSEPRSATVVELKRTSI